nr:PREDICTED: muscle M-line assembly protein unc-89-like [Bemisia tabaci]
MACNLGFRIGLLLDQFFSDRRKKCYYFINTDKVNTISELKETLTFKFDLPSDVQLMHNGFLLLDEDTVFVIRQDETIEVVPCSPLQEKSFLKERTEDTSSPSKREPHCSRAQVKSTNEKIPSSKDKITGPHSLQTNSDESSSGEKVKKKKKKKRNRSPENLHVLENSVDDASGMDYHSTPLNFVQASNKYYQIEKAESPSSSSNFIKDSVKTPILSESKHVFDDESEVQNLALESANPLSNSLNHVDSNRSNKRKWKNESNRLRYSGVAELIKQIQTSTSSKVETEEPTIDTVIDDSSPKAKRKRTRRHRKRKTKSNDNSFNTSNMAPISTENGSTEDFEELQSKPRLHKRFDSHEDVSLNFDTHQNAIATTAASHEINSHSRLCSQISPLTPPSEHNSEDDVYKKLLNLKKMNKPVVFERVLKGDVRNIQDEEKPLLTSEEVDAVPSNSEKNANEDQMEIIYQDTNEAVLPLKVVSNSSSNDEAETFIGTENQRSEIDSSKKEPCPVHIKKTICDNNLEKIDISNYPIIESTRKNDILVFKTLKLSASLSPTLSNLILARVLDTYPGTLILFEILGGEEELDFTTDGSLMEEHKTPNPLIKLNWTDLYEPRLLYP